VPATIPPLIAVSSPNIILDSIKKAEDSDDVVVRLHEAYGETLKTTMTFGVRADAAVECDLLEQEIGVLKISKSKLALKFSPFEIKTLRIKFRPKR
jgi:alpha-mannosidase